MITRREWLGRSLGAGAALALSPELLRALALSGSALPPAGGKLIQRAIPSSGQKLPVIGLSFSNHPTCANHDELKDVLKTLFDNDGTVFDAMHGNATSEQFHIEAATELGIQKKLFWSTRGTPPNAAPQPGAAFVNGHIDSLLERIKVPTIDLVLLPVKADPTNLEALKEEKKKGRVRHIGVQTIVAKSQSAELEALMRKEPIDFIGVDYDISNRHVEDTILPLARERKIAVMAFFPFSNNSGVSCTAMHRNLFARVGTTPLPEWAADLDAKTWAHFFLKYVISHPAVTVARVGTTKAKHMLDNMGGGIGRLPNEATRKRMAELIDALPPLPPLPQDPAQAPGIAVSVAVLDRYVGEYKAASGFTAIFRRDGDKLFVKPGNNSEVPLNARTETRFQDPRGPFFDFKLDDKGKVTGATLEQQGPQGPQHIPLERT
jgi:aryl-alcohol dehydrogenase-like predicted oxidoreductase